MVTAETEAFFDAARESRFLVPFCPPAARRTGIPRAICPFCSSDKVEWREGSGKGTIYTFSVMRRVKEPYVIAHVTLAEGPTMLTNIVDCDFDTVRIGQTGHGRLPGKPKRRAGADVQAGLTRHAGAVRHDR